MHRHKYSVKQVSVCNEVMYKHMHALQPSAAGLDAVQVGGAVSTLLWQKILTAALLQTPTLKLFSQQRSLSALSVAPKQKSMMWGDTQTVRQVTHLHTRRTTTEGSDYLRRVH